MESNQVFEADASLDRRLPSSHGARRRGHDATILTTGGIETHQNTVHEDTPLLAKTSHVGAGHSFSDHSSEDEPVNPQEWDKDFEGLPWWKKPSIFWILPPFLLSTLAFGGIIVPKLDILLALLCRDYLSDHRETHMSILMESEKSECNQIPQVQALVSNFTLYGNLISGILSAIISPKLGELSDRYGRKRLMACTACGLVASEVVTLVVASRPDVFSPYWILFGFFLDGVGGSFIAGMALIHAYAADCTSPAKRHAAFAYLHACLFTGIALGPFVAGYIVEKTGVVLSMFYISLGCHVFYIFYILVVVPESLTKERQMAAREKKKLDDSGYDSINWSDWSDWAFVSSLAKIIVKGGGIFTPLKILWPTGEGSSPAVRRNLVLIAAVDTTMFGVAMGSMTVVVIYTKYMFDWTTTQTSYFVGIQSTCRVINLLVLLPLVTRLVRGPKPAVPPRNTGSDIFELSIIRTAVAFDILGYIGYATVRTGNLLVLSGAVAAIGGMGSPTLQSALTKHVPRERVGALLGANGLLHALARVVAPTIFNGIYSKTVGKFTQTVFVCLASTFGVGFILSWFIKPHVYLEEPDQPRPAARNASAPEVVAES